MQKHCVVNTRLKHIKNLMHSRTAINRDIQPHLTWPLMLKICIGWGCKLNCLCYYPYLFSLPFSAYYCVNVRVVNSHWLISSTVKRSRAILQCSQAVKQ